MNPWAWVVYFVINVLLFAFGYFIGMNEPRKRFKLKPKISGKSVSKRVYIYYSEEN